METKKTNISDLECQRTTRFLLGLIFVLALLFVGLEYTSRDKKAKDNDQLIDDMSQDIDMIPAMDQKDMVSYGSSAPSSPSVTNNIKAVDHTPKTLEEVSPNSNPLMVGNGEGQAADATVTQALPQTPVEVDEHGNPKEERIVEQLPEFPGGMVEFMKWLTRNLRYPPMAQRQRIEGKVVVSFIVNKDGSIANVKLEKSADPDLDREALRVIRMMPKWKPGIENNKPCRTMFAIPVVFKL